MEWWFGIVGVFFVFFVCVICCDCFLNDVVDVGEIVSEFVFIRVFENFDWFVLYDVVCEGEVCYVWVFVWFVNCEKF